MIRWYRMIALTSMLFVAVKAAANTFTLYTEHLPPYAYAVDGQVQGYSVDIIAELFNRAGYEYAINILPLKRAVQMTKVQNQSCFFPLERNQEREVDFHWVSPVLISHAGFYVLKNSNIHVRTLADVKAYNVGSYAGSAIAEYLVEQGINTSQITYDAPNIKMLQSKRIDIWAADTLVADYLLRDAKVTDIEQALEYSTTLRALACNLNVPVPVIDRLSAELVRMYKDGTIGRLRAKYHQ